MKENRNKFELLGSKMDSQELCNNSILYTEMPGKRQKGKTTRSMANLHINLHGNDGLAHIKCQSTKQISQPRKQKINHFNQCKFEI